MDSIFAWFFFYQSNDKVENFTCNIIYLHALRELEILVPGGICLDREATEATYIPERLLRCTVWVGFNFNVPTEKVDSRSGDLTSIVVRIRANPERTNDR